MSISNATKTNTVELAADAIARISNADVRWDGTFIGLTPILIGCESQQLASSGDVAIPQLVNVLEDPSKFVVAHVLLTALSGVEYQAWPWNGLAVELNADGQVSIDAGQRYELARRWLAWLQTTPHPRTLP